MFKTYKYRILFAFLLTYLLLADAFSSFHNEKNEDFSMLDNFYVGSLPLLSSEFDFSHPNEINTDSNNIITSTSAPIEPQTDSTNQLHFDNFTWEVSERDIYTEDFFMDFTPPPLNEITNNISCLVTTQSEIQNTTSTKNDENTYLPEDEQPKTLASAQIINKKRKISLEEVSESEEKKINEKINQSRIKKTRKYISWTTPMRDHLKMLKNEINPVTQRGYTRKEIAQKMTVEFWPVKFSVDSVQSKWKKIGKGQIGKDPKWDKNRENLLISLKAIPSNTYEIIADKMNEKFPQANFTGDIVRAKYYVIKKKGFPGANLTQDTVGTKYKAMKKKKLRS